MIHGISVGNRITNYLLDNVGGGLRAVIVVPESGFEIAYLNDRLEESYSMGTLANIVEAFRLDQPFFPPDIDGAPVGERRAVVHYYENAFVLQFPVSSTETILIGVDCEVDRDLLEFIDTCRRLVHVEN